MNAVFCATLSLLFVVACGKTLKQSVDPELRSNVSEIRRSFAPVASHKTWDPNHVLCAEYIALLDRSQVLFYDGFGEKTWKAAGINRDDALQIYDAGVLVFTVEMEKLLLTSPEERQKLKQDWSRNCGEITDPTDTNKLVDAFTGALYRGWIDKPTIHSDLKAVLFESFLERSRRPNGEFVDEGTKGLALYWFTPEELGIKSSPVSDGLEIQDIRP